ncbi:hypothetical protein L249_6173 [Ophiocordyceps polyrhachis-furcata BCC 54312]|uniref:Centromere protein X n=1 Tax=Ophiocordyceps polyrhachis-furcata BCC 54312 TaxID=1330021 RepID=A0A367LIL9_9HYPO|nr:hypothetical protein L249_6173 [Ophiocordyceps polyrhachis-furcata BCC 54312]
MQPKRASGATRGRPKGSKSKKAAATSPEPLEVSDAEEATAEAEEQTEPEKTIPRDLLTRVLHEFFVKGATRISRDANAAVGKYVDVFVREAIVRAAVDKKGGFLEVEDLEKIAPQLLLDL